MLERHLLGGSRLGEYVHRVIKEDMLHQFGCYIEMRNLTLSVTVPTTELTDKKYTLGLFLESLTGERVQARTLCYQDERVNGPSIFGGEGNMSRNNMEELAKAGRQKWIQQQMSGKRGSKQRGNNKAAALSADELKKLSGSASGVSLACVMAGQSMFHFLEKVRQIYLPDRDLPPVSSFMQTAMTKLPSISNPNNPLKNPHLGAFSSKKSTIDGLESLSAFSAFPFIAAQSPSCGRRFLDHISNGSSSADRAFTEKIRRSYMSRYYQVWDPSTLPSAREKRHNLMPMDNPKMAVTTLCMPLEEGLKFPDNEVNFEALQSLLSLSSSSGTSKTFRLYLRPTLQVLFPSRDLAGQRSLISGTSLGYMPSKIRKNRLPEFPPEHQISELHFLTLMDYYLSQLFNPYFDRLYYTPKASLPLNLFTGEA